MTALRSLVVVLALPMSAATFTSDDSTTLHYTSLGKGPVVVLLSGGPGFSSDYMAAIAKPLKKRYRFILLDQRGTGRSTLATYDATTLDHKRLVADVDALRRTLKLEKLTLIGHSWGGILSMLYASAHPDRVNALILVDSGGPTTRSVAKFAANHTARMTKEDSARVAEWSGKLASDHKRAVLEITRARTAPYFYDAAKAKAFADALDETSFNDAVFWPIVGQINASFDLRPALRQVSVPVLVIHGKHDPLESAEEVRDAFAGSRLEMIEKAGHFPWLEQPQTFTRILDGFLRKVVKR